jgi:hypothetical protein
MAWRLPVVCLQSGAHGHRRRSLRRAGACARMRRGGRQRGEKESREDDRAPQTGRKPVREGEATWEDRRRNPVRVSARMAGRLRIPSGPAHSPVRRLPAPISHTCFSFADISRMPAVKAKPCVVSLRKASLRWIDLVLTSPRAMQELLKALEEFRTLGIDFTSRREQERHTSRQRARAQPCPNFRPPLASRLAGRRSGAGAGSDREVP